MKAFFKRHLRLGIGVAGTGLCLLAFQNCGQGFQTLNEGVETSLSNLPTQPNVNTGGGSGSGTGSGSGSGSSGSTGGGGGGGGSSVSFTMNDAASAISASAVTGAPRAGAILQRDSTGQATVQMIFQNVSASYYGSQLICNGSVSSSATPTSFPGNTLSFRVITGLQSCVLRVSFYDSSGRENQRFTTSQFGVGEIFLIAGQSNSAGHGESPQASSQPLNKVLSPETGAWQALQDPLPFATNWGNAMYGSQSNPGGSPWPAMADRLSSVLNVPVGVVSVGWGGSYVSEWVNGNATMAPLIERLIKGSNAIGSCGFRAVLWHQGESDSVGRTSRANYKNLLRTLRSNFQSRTGCSQTWLVARASQSLPETNTPLANIMDIRGAQTDLWSESGFGRGPDTDLMSGRSYRYDLLHFSVRGLTIHGQMWANHIGAIFGKSVLLDTNYVGEAQQVYSLYQTVLGRSAADMEIDHDGLYYHTNRLQMGAATASVVQSEFLNSDETFIRGRYYAKLGRYATFAEIQRWQARITAGEFGGSRDALAAAIAREI